MTTAETFDQHGLATCAYKLSRLEILWDRCPTPTFSILDDDEPGGFAEIHERCENCDGTGRLSVIDPERLVAVMRQRGWSVETRGPLSGQWVYTFSREDRLGTAEGESGTLAAYRAACEAYHV